MSKTHLLSLVIVVLFCWVIYPYKWFKKAMFLNKRNKAIKQADKRQKTCNSTVMVVQIGEVFKVGIKSELKQLDKFVRKYYHLNKNEFFVWDYRNSIIYKAK